MPDDKKTLLKDKKLSSRYVLPAAVALILGLVLILALVVFHHKQTPIPQRVRKSVDYSIYYPSTLPAGYYLDSSSVKLQNRIVFYVLKRGNSQIYVSEQALPNRLPDLSSITGFNRLNINNGSAAIGLNGDQPVVIMITPTTLINMSGSSGLPTEVLGSVAQNLKAL